MWSKLAGHSFSAAKRKQESSFCRLSVVLFSVKQSWSLKNESNAGLPRVAGRRNIHKVLEDVIPKLLKVADSLVCFTVGFIFSRKEERECKILQLLLVRRCSPQKLSREDALSQKETTL